jgi:hypothetical protein
MALTIGGVGSATMPLRAASGVSAPEDEVLAVQPVAKARAHVAALPAIFALTRDMLAAGPSADGPAEPYSQRDLQAAAQAYGARRQALALRSVRTSFQGQAAVSVMGAAGQDLTAFRRALSI